MSTLRKILEEYKNGKISLSQAEKEIKLFSIKKVGALGNIDLHRDHRAGVPEVIFGEGKTDKEILSLAGELVKEKGRCIISRLPSERIKRLRRNLKKPNIEVESNEKAGILIVREKRYKRPRMGGRVAIISAGTTDISKAEEARVISEEMGCEVYTYYDVGVAGIHRLIPAVEDIVKKDVDAVIVAAGMEGALPSVVAGLLDIPVIGLPISTGYGAGGGGEAALLSILQSCSPGLVAVNIDNGYGAGAVASIIANRVAKFRG
jgi:hypothetical protein